MPEHQYNETQVRVLKLEPTDVETASLLAAIGRGDASVTELVRLLSRDEISIDEGNA